MAVDSGRPFPLIQNKTLNLGVLLEDPSEESGVIFATVQVPSVLDRVVALPGSDAPGMDYLLMEDVLACFIDRLFIGKRVLATAPYRITRNGDLDIDEDEAEDLLMEIEKSLRQRRWGMAVRLELAKGTDRRIRAILLDEMELGDEDLFEFGGPLDLTLLFRMYGFPGSGAFKYPLYVPKGIPAFIHAEDLFATIRAGDVLMHHPYESFVPVVDLIRAAARDPAVLAIKQTLYRVSGTSPIVQALADAAENGKQVTVLVELKARFDEANNIQWAKQLEKAGCHVIYGLVGLKTHSKITLIVRMEEEGIQRYVHLSTGNYNDVTARIYTDISLLTCAGRFGEDASAVFNALSGFSDSPRLKKIVMAPTMLRKRFYELIEREVAHVRAGRKGLICAKMNALVDPGIIEALYKASMAGVVIDLLVRGTCSLRPGLPGISENISVRSIVGRYLEHSRIYWFGNGGEPEVYLSSADWMERNMDRRVELLFPIEDETLRRRVEEILFIYASDTQKARFMNADGVYRKRDRRRKKGPGTGKGTGVVCPVQPEAFTDKLVSELREQHGTRLEAQALFMTLAARADERARQQGRGLGAIPGPVS
jgi:polyphosphate kinase